MMKHREATLRAPVRLISGLAWSPHYQITQFIVLMEALRLNRREKFMARRVTWRAAQIFRAARRKREATLESPLKYRVLGTCDSAGSHHRGEMEPERIKTRLGETSFGEVGPAKSYTAGCEADNSAAIKWFHPPSRCENSDWGIESQ